LFILYIIINYQAVFIDIANLILLFQGEILVPLWQ